MQEEKRVLYISPNGYLGGAEKAIIDYCKAHNEYGSYRAEIYFLNDGEAVTIAKQNNIQTHILKNKFRLSNLFQLFKSCMQFRQFLKTNNYEILNSGMPYSHIFTVLSTLGLNKKLVWYQHGPVGGVLDKIASYLPCNLICFNTKFTQNTHNRTSFSKLFENVKQAITPYVIYYKEPNDCNVSVILSEFRATPKSKLLLQAGRICSWKGYHLTIAAMNELKKKYSPDNIKLIIIGEAKRENDKEYYKELLDLVKEYSLENYITFLGFKENVFDYMNASDFFIHSSTTPEPFGLVVAEAILARTTVVASSKGGVSDLISENTGYSYDTTKADAHLALLKALDKAIKSNNLEKIKENAYTLVSSKYSPQNAIINIESEYDKI